MAYSAWVGLSCLPVKNWRISCFVLRRRCTIHLIFVSCPKWLAIQTRPTNKHLKHWCRRTHRSLWYRVVLNRQQLQTPTLLECTFPKKALSNIPCNTVILWCPVTYSTKIKHIQTCKGVGRVDFGATGKLWRTLLYRSLRLGCVCSRLIQCESLFFTDWVCLRLYLGGNGGAPSCLKIKWTSMSWLEHHWHYPPFHNQRKTTLTHGMACMWNNWSLCLTPTKVDLGSVKTWRCGDIETPKQHYGTTTVQVP